MQQQLVILWQRLHSLYPFIGACASLGLLYYGIFQTHIPGVSIDYFLDNFQSFSFDWQIILISTIPCYFLILAIIATSGGWYIGRLCLEIMSSHPTPEQYAQYYSKSH